MKIDLSVWGNMGASLAKAVLQANTRVMTFSLPIVVKSRLMLYLTLVVRLPAVKNFCRSRCGIFLGVKPAQFF